MAIIRDKKIGDRVSLYLDKNGGLTKKVTNQIIQADIIGILPDEKENDPGIILGWKIEEGTSNIIVFQLNDVMINSFLLGQEEGNVKLVDNLADYKWYTCVHCKLTLAK